MDSDSPDIPMRETEQPPAQTSPPVASSALPPLETAPTAFDALAAQSHASMAPQPAPVVLVQVQTTPAGDMGMPQAQPQAQPMMGVMPVEGQSNITTGMP